MNNYNKIYKLTKNFTVLYIEDDKAFAQETTEVFEDLFFKIDTATDGKKGFELYQTYFETNKKYYDIVITDINMPQMNGIELVKEIYKINQNQPIIVISAHDESQYLLELINLGIDHFLIKPLDFDILLAALCRVTCKVLKNGTCLENKRVIPLKDGITWDKENSVLYKKKETIKLTKNETILMQIFIKNQCKISTPHEIFAALYTDPENSSISNLKPLISRLRKKIPNQTIESIYGLGYRLIF